MQKVRGRFQFDRVRANVYEGLLDQAPGDIFWVDSRSWGSGSDLRSGKSPATCLATIAAALALCEAGKNDYVFCLDGYDNDAITIEVVKSAVHIIGLGNKNHRAPFVWLKIAGTGAAAVFSLRGSDAANVEIAGFTLGADATHPCITRIAGTTGTELIYGHIHDCAFAASLDAAFVAQDGILFSAGGDGCLIEDCYFGAQLVRDGIRFVNMYGGLIRNCIFSRYGGIGVDSIAGGAATGMPDVLDNRFYVGTTPAKGAGITIIAAGGGIIDGNRSVEDGGHAGNNLYLDTSSGTDTTTKNGWGVNYHGDVVTYPAFA